MKYLYLVLTGLNLGVAAAAWWQYTPPSVLFYSLDKVSIGICMFVFYLQALQER